MAAAEQEKGFVFKGRFSKSIDLNLLKENMERRLAFVRSLKPDKREHSERLEYCPAEHCPASELTEFDFQKKPAAAGFFSIYRQKK